MEPIILTYRRTAGDKKRFSAKSSKVFNKNRSVIDASKSNILIPLLQLHLIFALVAEVEKVGMENFGIKYHAMQKRI